jgi:prepilin-type N-terminal cleavage/methylation domain-containing protein
MARRGFTLVEVAVAVAVLAILAGAMAPMALKAVHQQREAATRESLRLAFEAMFGARDRRVANMRADFGFDPDRGCAALPFLLTRSWGKVPAYGPHDGASFPWGWNGPYWQGPVRGGAPVDAWGNPIELVFDEARGTWQVHSPGPDRLTSVDDLYYPPVPAAKGAYQATVLVVITREAEDIGGTLALSCGGNQGLRLATETKAIDAKAPSQSFTFRAPAGGMQLEFKPTTGTFKPFTVPMDLLPGQTRDVGVRL